MIMNTKRALSLGTVAIAVIALLFVSGSRTNTSHVDELRSG
jgi:hypothetical protein